MKKLPLLFIVTGMFGIVALSLPSKEQVSLPNIQADLQLNLQSQLTVETSQDEEFTMKPAWYRFFNKHAAGNIKPQKNKSLQFVFPEEQSQKGFFNFKLANATEEAIKIRIQNGSLIMIQEAKNDKGDWQPIEYWDYDWGNGSVFDEYSLDPKNAILVSAPRYKGNFETDIRFKLKTGDSKEQDDVIYSPVFKGSISLSQFKLNPGKEDKTISYLK